MGLQHHRRSQPGRLSLINRTSRRRNRKKGNPSKLALSLYPHPFFSRTSPRPCFPSVSAKITPLAYSGRSPYRRFSSLSSVKYRESADGLTVTAIFDLPRVKKDDMHVSFQGSKLVVSWRVIKITEREEPIDADDLGSGTRILRELEHKKYCRTIPLPEGTKVRLALNDAPRPVLTLTLSQFEEIRAARDGRHLVLTYPNISTPRASPIAHDTL